MLYCLFHLLNKLLYSMQPVFGDWLYLHLFAFRRMMQRTQSRPFLYCDAFQKKYSFQNAKIQNVFKLTK